MKTVIAHQFRQIRMVTAGTLLCLWSLIALFVYTASVQYGEKSCWFSVFQNLQVLLPVAAVLPLAFWVDPFFSEQSAELLHSLPKIHHALFCALSFLLPSLWLCTVVFPLAFAWLLLPEFSFWDAIIRCSLQVFFSQALFLASGAMFRSTLNGIAVFLLTDGTMLLSMELPAARGTVLQTVNLFDSFSFVAQNPFSIEKEMIILSLTILLFALYLYCMHHYFSNEAALHCCIRQKNI